MIYVLQVELDSKIIKSIRKSLEKQNSVFLEKKYLDSLYLPSKIIGRKEQAVQLIRHIESLRQGLMVPVISVYGRSGSGKSTVLRFVCQNFDDVISFSFVNLRKSKTLFGCVNSVLSELGSEPLKSAEGLNKAVEKIGLKIEEILRSEKKQFFVLVLDEYDVIFSDKRGKPSDFMYKLLTLEENLREKNLWLCIITISNNALADYNLDDRVKSRIGNTEVFFSPYGTEDVFAILEDRTQKAFLTKPSDEVLQYCSKICSENCGDARRALDLLRLAGEISNGTILAKEDVDKANDELQKDRISTLVSSASYHQRVLLAAICSNLFNSKVGWTATSLIYDEYKKILAKDHMPLSYRRSVDLLIEIENSGLVVSRTLSRGRHGYGTEYRLVMSPELVGPKIDKKWWSSIVESKRLQDMGEIYQNTFGRRRPTTKIDRLLKKYGY